MIQISPEEDKKWKQATYEKHMKELEEAKKKVDRMKARVLICGDRNWNDKEEMWRFIAQLLTKVDIECIIEGECRGADRIAAAIAHDIGITVLSFPAKWDSEGKSAGVKRNQQMIEKGKPTMCLAFHNDIHNSKGTKDMMKRAVEAGIPVTLLPRNITFTNSKDLHSFFCEKYWTQPADCFCVDCLY
jgi:hypothetical protein